MPAGVFAGPYNKTVSGGIWTDPTDPTMSSEQSINPIIANKPFTMSVWVKPSTKLGERYYPINPGFFTATVIALERVMMDPAHNSQNTRQGITLSFNQNGYYPYSPIIKCSFNGNGDQRYLLTRGRPGGSMYNVWNYDRDDEWLNIIVAYEPGSTGTDRTKNYIYFQGDSTAAEQNGSAFDTVGSHYTGTFASGTVVNSIGQNGGQYNKIPGRRTFLGASGDSGSTTGIPITTITRNRVLQMKEIVIWDRILTSSEVQEVWNSGTSLGNKDNYPNTPKIGWMFPNDGVTYDPNHYNSQQNQYGQIRVPNVYNSSYGTLTSNYGRVTNQAAYMKQYWFPSPLINDAKAAISI